MLPEKPAVRVYTLGCKVNQYESSAIAARLAEAGFRFDTAGGCGVCIVNTCTVTAESDRKSRQAVRRAISQNPGAFVVVTGCWAQLNPDAAAAIEGVGFVCGNDNKIDLTVGAVISAAAALPDGNPSNSGNNDEYNPDKPSRERVRAYIKIQDGCEGSCSYCIIPRARGRIRSRPAGEIVTEAAELWQSRCREIVLTGIETASYGRDFGGVDKNTGVDLIDLIEALDTAGIGRIRLGSLDPAAITGDFAARLSRHKCAAPHFHISAQSGSDGVLRRMNRSYGRADLEKSAALLRGYFPDAMLTADIITGFPGENEREFAETRGFLTETRFFGVHIFPYSKRPGTPAAGFAGQLPESVKRERAAELSALQREIKRELLREACGGVHEVLFERTGGGFAAGHAPNFIEVRVKSGAGAPEPGEIAPVRLVGSDDEYCYGELLG